MTGKIADKVRFQHILDAIEEIEKYVGKIDFNKFKGNSMMKFACVKQLEIIGEASNMISEATKDKYPEIEWRKIVGLRNILVHEYFGIDEKIIWDIIQNDLNDLKNKIEKII